MHWIFTLSLILSAALSLQGAPVERRKDLKSKGNPLSEHPSLLRRASEIPLLPPGDDLAPAALREAEGPLPEVSDLGVSGDGVWVSGDGPGFSPRDRLPLAFGADGAEA
ncbi:hypothetical protein chiPu_0012398 [Chiloscyllium punctatum]|uniref:Uncharacterized protein n=1 Tax=Chiloscyllium punctatum TaxID=137246 RepID=A0A401SU40_CHIPU|nr:hypothetical protein [Chiloscyllium punctatum]